MDNSSMIIYLVAVFLAVMAIVAYTKKGKVLGMGKNVTGTIFALVAIFLFLWQSGTLTQLGVALPTLSVAGVQTVPTATTGTSIVTSNPVIQMAGQDAQQSGTAVSGSGQVSVNGGGFYSVTLGTTTAVPGQTVDLFITNGTTYHNQVVKGISVTPTSFPVSIAFNKNATVTENVYTTTGLVITNGGGAQNQTDLGNGASYNLKDEMTASALTSTQDMTCIIEITAGSNASTSPAGASLALNGNALALKSTAKPVWYTLAGADSNVYIFDVPALSTSATQTLTIGLNSKSTGRFSALSKVIKTCYTKEYFIDTTTGKIAYDVADSVGTVKSMAKYAYTVVFQ